VFATVNNVAKSKGSRTYIPDLVFFDEFNEYNRRIPNYKYNLFNVHSNFSDVGKYKFPTIVFLGNRISKGKDDFMRDLNLNKIEGDVHYDEDASILILKKEYTKEEIKKIENIQIKNNKFYGAFKKFGQDNYFFKGEYAFDFQNGVLPLLDEDITNCNEPKYYCSIAFYDLNKTLQFFDLYKFSYLENRNDKLKSAFLLNRTNVYDKYKKYYHLKTNHSTEISEYSDKLLPSLKHYIELSKVF
jgi:hypothetical protein